MQSVNLRKLKKQFAANKRLFRHFITRVEKRSPEKLAFLSDQLDKEVWAEVNCLGCANCCRVMSHTYTWQDINPHCSKNIYFH